jgi:hypothetical protein
VLFSNYKRFHFRQLLTVQFNKHLILLFCSFGTDFNCHQGKKAHRHNGLIGERVTKRRRDEET